MNRFIYFYLVGFLFLSTQNAHALFCADLTQEPSVQVLTAMSDLEQKVSSLDDEHSHLMLKTFFDPRPTSEEDKAHFLDSLSELKLEILHYLEPKTYDEFKALSEKIDESLEEFVYTYNGYWYSQMNAVEYAMRKEQILDFVYERLGLGYLHQLKIVALNTLQPQTLEQYRQYKKNIEQSLKPYTKINESEFSDLTPLEFGKKKQEILDEVYAYLNTNAAAFRVYGDGSVEFLN